MGNREEDAAADVIEGTVVPEDIIRANLRAAGFPVGSAADARAIRAGAEQWARDFAAACREEDPVVIDRPRPAEAAAGASSPVNQAKGTPS